jgi:hypothetical protein
LAQDIKKKVANWLKEEGFPLKEVPDPDAGFNFSVKVGGFAIDVVQNLRRDAILVRSTLVFNKKQTTQLKGMEEKRRQEFLWDLRMRLLNNNEVGTFTIKPNLERMEVLVQSRGIFHDALTKDRFIHAIIVVHKAITMVIWMVKWYSGEGKPTQTSLYIY